MMESKKFVINTREGEKVSFDIEADEFTVRVLQAGDDCTVIDDIGGRLYMVKKADMADAVRAYLDWALGVVNVWVADPDEFGCYERSDEECWASKCCDVREIRDDWYVIGER